jgi:hypothetical protein
VANPYLYLEPARPTGSGADFAIPDTSCDYDEHKYGLRDRPPYPSGLSSQELIHNYTTRRVTYLLGSADTRPNHDFDDSCARGCKAVGPGSSAARATTSASTGCIGPLRTSSWSSPRWDTPTTRSSNPSRHAMSSSARTDRPSAAPRRARPHAPKGSR